MLPSSLLITRIRKGKIRPAFAQLNDHHREIATTLIGLFQHYIGKKKGNLMAEAKHYEELGKNFKFVRGLITLLERRCVFTFTSHIDPSLVRRIVFDLASKVGIATTPEKRQTILLDAAERLETTPERLATILWCDLDSELILQEFKPIDDLDLLKYYNLSLLQTLLFNSSRLSFTVQSNWKEVFRYMKFLGLMYTIDKSRGSFWVNVDGPASLFKITKIYGSAMAKLVAPIIRGKDWKLQAEIVKGQIGGSRILKLDLNSKLVGIMFPSYHLQDIQMDVFDSIVERNFAQRFQALNTGWALFREPEPLQVGNHVMLPDFSFVKRGIKVYLEIVGFWTPTYLQKKIEKLRQLHDERMILAVNRDLACAKLKELNIEIIYYKRHVPLKPIIQKLEELEKLSISREVERLNAVTISLKDEIIHLTALAQKHATSTETLLRTLEEQAIDGYRVIGNYIIKDTKLTQIQKKIVQLQELDLLKVLQIIEDEGIHEPYRIIDELGYRIKWSGLDFHTSLLSKKNNSTT